MHLLTFPGPKSARLSKHKVLVVVQLYATIYLRVPKTTPLPESSPLAAPATCNKKKGRPVSMRGSPRCVVVLRKVSTTLRGLDARVPVLHYAGAWICAVLVVWVWKWCRMDPARVGMGAYMRSGTFGTVHGERPVQQALGMHSMQSPKRSTVYPVYVHQPVRCTRGGGGGGGGTASV